MCVCVCVSLYLNSHLTSISVLLSCMFDSFLGSEAVLAGPHNFQGLFECSDLVLRSWLCFISMKVLTNAKIQ